MSNKENSDHELLIRIDERVKGLCETTEELLKEQGELETKAKSNEKDIESIQDDISYNRKLYISGVLVTIFVFVMTQLLLESGVT